MCNCRKCGKELAGWEEDNYINKCADCHEEYIKWLNGKTKEQIFVRHIEKHLKDLDMSGQCVCCKICGKTIDEIYKEQKSLFTPNLPK